MHEFLIFPDNQKLETSKFDEYILLVPLKINNSPTLDKPRKNTDLSLLSSDSFLSDCDIKYFPSDGLYQHTAIFFSLLNVVPVSPRW